MQFAKIQCWDWFNKFFFDLTQRIKKRKNTFKKMSMALKSKKKSAEDAESTPKTIEPKTRESKTPKEGDSQKKKKKKSRRKSFSVIPSQNISQMVYDLGGDRINGAARQCVKDMASYAATLLIDALVTINNVSKRKRITINDLMGAILIVDSSEISKHMINEVVRIKNEHMANVAKKTDISKSKPKDHSSSTEPKSKKSEIKTSKKKKTTIQEAAVAAEKLAQ